MHEKKRFRVVIVGASLAGLTLATCLQRAGVDYVLLERKSRAEVVETIGILDQLGVWRPHLESRSVAERIASNFGFNGAFLCSFDWNRSDAVKEYGYPLVFVQESHVLQALVSSGVDESQIITGAAVTAFTESEHGIRACTADGSTYEGSVLVGADGPDGIVSQQWLSQPAFPSSSKHAALWGTSTWSGGSVQAGDVLSSHFNGYATTTVFGPRKDLFWWYLLFPNNQKAEGESESSSDMWSLSASALAQIYGDSMMSDDISFGDAWDARTGSEKVRLDEGVRDTWSRSRVVLIGNAVHMMPLNSLYGAGLSLEGAATLTNEIHSTLPDHQLLRPSSSSQPNFNSTDPQKIDEDFQLDLTAVKDIFSRYESIHRERAERYLNAYQTFMDLYVKTTAPIATHGPVANLWSFPKANPVETLNFVQPTRQKKKYWSVFRLKDNNSRSSRSRTQNMLLTTAIAAGASVLVAVAVQKWRKM